MKLLEYSLDICGDLRKLLVSGLARRSFCATRDNLLTTTKYSDKANRAL